MRMLNVIQSVAERKRTALTQSPFGEFAVLGVLLVATHYGMSTMGNDANPSLPMTTNHAQATVDQAMLPTTQSRTVQLDAAQVDALVDRLNQARTISANNLAAAQGIAPLSREQSTARFTLKHLAQRATDSQANKKQATPNKQYQFKPSLVTTLGQTADTDLFDAAGLASTALAIWDINNTFSLAHKNRIRIPTAKKSKPNEKFVIMLDPGHGGSDPGSIGHNGLQEKVLTLEIAKRTQLFLSEIDNIEVVLTRNGDNGMSRKNRVRKVKQSNADMVVSLHLNHLPQTDVNLVETFYAAPHNILESIEKQRADESKNGMVKTAATHNHDLSFTKGSRQLATLMQKRVFDEVISNNPDTDNAGVKEDTLYILTRSFTPGVLIELSCLSNIQEAERLNDPAYRDKLAAALADGIRDYLTTPEAKRQFGPGV